MSDYNPYTHPERVLISYSHDSPEHEARVAELARRLRKDGVYVMLDRYAPHPAEGWPQWMRREIAQATHVLIVCTETYLRRVDLHEEPGRGLGATWEGSLVILATYAGQGLNEKFIPIVFSPADQAFVPDFLQGVTRYDVSTEQGYEQLYARITGQQLVEVRSGWGPVRVWVAYGDSAYEGSVEVADRSRDASGERWSVIVAVEERSRGYNSEMTTSGKSVDEIAELRARRILLNERPPGEVARWGNIDSTLEMLVQGMGSPRPLTESPIPALYRQFGDDVPLFLAAARLVAVLELQRTETVEHVLDLAFALNAPGRLHVRFRGRRRKVYTNRPAHEMVFEGVCLLD